MQAQNLTQANPGLKIHIPGFDSAEKWLAWADAIVLPSRREGLSNALLEAMALGCAVIATPVGEQDSVLRHQQNALVVTPGDVDGLAAALLELITNENLRHALGAIARADIRNGMTSDVSLARIAAALRQAAQR
jgi:glycosyltransferase involved in cell wall biosynthesis